MCTETVYFEFGPGEQFLFIIVSQQMHFDLSNHDS